MLFPMQHPDASVNVTATSAAPAVLRSCALLFSMLYGNQMSGTIPPAIGTMTNLVAMCVPVRCSSEKHSLVRVSAPDLHASLLRA
jgi:hypothetical protein